MPGFSKLICWSSNFYLYMFLAAAIMTRLLTMMITGPSTSTITIGKSTGGVITPNNGVPYTLLMYYFRLLIELLFCFGLLNSSAAIITQNDNFWHYISSQIIQKTFYLMVNRSFAILTNETLRKTKNEVVLMCALGDYLI